jgi:3'-phosphoadenosine 5'-phosphosulfate sulfotransferase (PAPS reductase)/FAD synthetase
MEEMTRKGFLMWAKTEEHRAKVQESLKVIKRYTEKGKCMVAFSGGKDSTVMLHLALQVEPKIDVFHWNHGSYLMPQSIEDEVIANARQLGANNLMVKSSSLLEKPDVRSNYKVWYLVFWNTLHRTRKDESWDYQFVGLRKEEGCRRTAKIKARPKGEVYPIADWAWSDVWAYIVSQNLGYPKIYDKYAALIGYDKARLVTFFDTEFEKFGSPYLDGFLLPQHRSNHVEKQKTHK